ncbi:hypothetical protein LZC95_40270 [Pendulispora brunnea]|uniref:Uncharacterized protein n=1 Tax=Pendulispora brunnea TaxID=2905690 RepID=A0ABZ2K1R2_9BACT
MSEKLDPIAPDVAALLDAERHYDDEPVARQGRVLERLAATTAALAPPAASPPSSLLPKAILKTKLAVAAAAAMVGAVGGGVVGYRLGEKARPPAPVVFAPASVITAEVAPPIVAPDAAPPPPSQASAVRPAPPPRTKKDDSADTLAVELSLVQMARAALARGNYAAALDATEQHARAFPKGHLTEERESLAIQALVGAGRDAEARARAARFRAKYPQSPLLPTLPTDSP